jgi:hypothetical protein
MLVYALGRGLGPADGQVIDGVVRQLEANDYRFLALVLAITQSEPFQMRAINRGEP